MAAGTLQTVFDAIGEALQPLNISVHAGPEHFSDNMSPPHIHMWPAEESFPPMPPRFVGPPRVWCVRSVSILTEIWGEDYDDVETMIQFFIYALKVVLGKSYELVGGKWMQQNGAAIVQKGRFYRLEWRLVAPVTVPAGAEGYATITETGDAATSDNGFDPSPQGA